MHPETGPEYDGKFPWFIFERDCECRACMQQKAMHDSYKVWTLANLWSLIRKRHQEMRAPSSPEALKDVVQNYVVLKRASREALNNWEPVLPVTVH